MFDVTINALPVDLIKKTYKLTCLHIADTKNDRRNENKEKFEDKNCKDRVS